MTTTLLPKAASWSRHAKKKASASVLRSPELKVFRDRVPPRACIGYDGNSYIVDMEAICARRPSARVGRLNLLQAEPCIEAREVLVDGVLVVREDVSAVLLQSLASLVSLLLSRGFCSLLG